MEVPGILSILKSSPISRNNLNSLIEISFKISLKYSTINSGKLFKQIEIYGDTIEDMAIEAIAPLFLKNSDSQIQIVRIFEKWGEKIECEEEAFYFLNRIISRRVNQHITHMLKDADPFFAKIFDSINYLIKKDGYKKQNYLGKIFIIEKKIGDNAIGSDVFETLPYNLFEEESIMIRKILDYLENDTPYFPAIPLSAFVKKLKYIWLEDQDANLKVTNFTRNYEIKESVNSALNYSVCKLIHSYGKNRKLNESEIKKFEITLSDIAIDLMDGGLRPGLYEYLKKNMPELKKEQYKLKYQNILEYLLKLMKNKVSQDIENY